LEVAPRVGERFTREMLDRTIAGHDTFPEINDCHTLEMRALLLENAIRATGPFRCFEYIVPLLGCFEHLQQVRREAPFALALQTLADVCFGLLRRLGMRDELSRVASQWNLLVQEACPRSDKHPEYLAAHLVLVPPWYFVGDAAQAEGLLHAAREVLLRRELPARDQTKLACGYASALAAAPPPFARERLEEIFTSVKGVKDFLTASTHYSVSKLELIEESVFAGVAASR